MNLLPAQMSALKTRGREMLVGAEPKSGASHLLRLMALVRAFTRPHQSVVIGASDDRKMREEHLEGPGGLWSLLEQAAAVGAVRWMPGGLIRLQNGSSIQMTTWDGAVRRNPDVMLLDDVEEMPFALFSKLRERTLRGPTGDSLPRLVVTSHRPGEGWARDHFGQGDGEIVRVDLRSSDLPATIRAALPPPVELPSFGDFIQRVLPDFPWYKHTEVLVDVMQQVVNGTLLRLLVMAPPRYYKSLVISRLLPAYWLFVRPWEWVTAISAMDELALTFSKDARHFFAQAGGVFRVDSQAAALWRTLRGGGMWARTVEGGALGFGYNLGILDDPFKNWEAAQRLGVQLAVETYFWNTFYNRRDLSAARPAAIVVMHQRLGEGDLAGRLLAREASGALGTEGWTVMDLPAVRRPRRVALPATVTVIPDWRQEGEALCPEIQTVEELDRLERANQISHAAIYQQDPEPDQSGGIFDREWWPEVGDPELMAMLADDDASLSEVINTLQVSGDLPAIAREARAWDIAATKKDAKGDSAASDRAAVTQESDGGEAQIIFTDAFERKVGPSGVKELIMETARADGKHVEVILPQDPGAAGKILVTDYKQALEAEGFTVIVRRPTGSKRVRATPHAGAAKFNERTQTPGRCRVLRGEWNTLFRERHHKFTGLEGGADDLVDAASDVFSELDIPTEPKAEIW